MDEAAIRALWDALARGDLEPVGAALAPDAKWRAVEDGPWNCESRSAILDVLRRNAARGLSGRIETVQEAGERRIVGFRPDRPNLQGWPLDDGVRYLVLTFREDKVAEMKGCADHAAALAYATS